MTKKILIIEDNQKHLADARKLLEERVSTGAIGSVTYADTLSRAMDSLRTENYDGIISDVFFHQESGGLEEQYGTHVAEHCLSLGLPVILATSTWHHGERTQPVHVWADKREMSLIDSGTGNKESESKNWEGAYLALTYLIEGKECGEIQINSQGMSQLAWFGIKFASQACEYKRKGNFEEIVEGLKPENYKAIMKRAIEKYCRGIF